MKYIATLLLIITTTLVAHAQTYEVGAIVGGTNFIGDVGRTNYISPNDLALGAIIKWNRSKRHSFRASFMLAKISGDDAKSADNSRNGRGLSFENTVKEISIGIEYTFWDFDVHSEKPIYTPYLYTGLTGFSYNALSKRGGSLKEYDYATSLAIPMVLGFKGKIGPNAMMGFEIGARYTFTDDLDGSNPVRGLSGQKGLIFGNKNNNDWYVFTGITVTFAFGRKPCYCNF